MTRGARWAVVGESGRALEQAATAIRERDSDTLLGIYQRAREAREEFLRLIEAR